MSGWMMGVFKWSWDKNGGKLSWWKRDEVKKKGDDEGVVRCRSDEVLGL